MTPQQILQWASLGAQLVTTLGVPIASVIRLFREAGGTDADAEVLLQQWTALKASVDARIAALRAEMK